MFAAPWPVQHTSGTLAPGRTTDHAGWVRAVLTYPSLDQEERSNVDAGFDMFFWSLIALRRTRKRTKSRPPDQQVRARSRHSHVEQCAGYCLMALYQ
jgi:hypothetical protein